MIKLQSEPFSAQKELNAFRKSHGTIGALASFEGFVRGEDKGEQVLALEIEHYPKMCEQELERIGEAAKDKFGLQDYLIIHRFGRIEKGEPIVLVSATARHRKPAIGAVEMMIDYIKTHAPFWKQQETKNGKSWLSPD